VLPAAGLELLFPFGPVVLAEVRFTGLPGAVVPDGNYRAQVLATDLAGNTMPSPFQMDFFILYGDADRDRDVDIADFSAVASNFNVGNRTFSQGDFNYDRITNIADFAILAQRFNNTLPAAGALPRAAGSFARGLPGSRAEGLFGDRQSDFLPE
jgi:hypothetical protein